MRVLFVCDSGDGMLDLAMRSRAVGHQARMFLGKYHPRTRPVGRGLVEMVEHYRPHLDWADLVILEGNGKYLAEMEMWQRRGCRVIGGTPESASWELDRSKGMEVFRRAGIAVPAYREFSNYDDAIRFVERQGEVFYSKPCSDTADKSLSAKTGIKEDPTWMLRKWKKKHGRPPSPFLLQESLEGIEFAVSGWFGPAGFAHAWEHNAEHKRLFAGDLGPNCGESGTVMQFVARSKLADLVLVPLEEQLAAIGYVGSCDVNCIIDAEGNAWPLEFTTRFGWPAFNLETALFEVDPLDFFMALACGESTQGAHRMNEVCTGVVLALPPWPYPPRDYEELIGVPLFGLTPELEEHFHPCEMIAGEDTALASAGDYLGVATGLGSSVRESARAAYRVLRQLHLPGSPFWRVDIGARLAKEIPKLNEHGFALGLDY
jgi:phosphoribosylamine--glycine ligase